MNDIDKIFEDWDEDESISISINDLVIGRTIIIKYSDWFLKSVKLKNFDKILTGIFIDIIYYNSHRTNIIVKNNINNNIVHLNIKCIKDITYE